MVHRDPVTLLGERRAMARPMPRDAPVTKIARFATHRPYVGRLLAAAGGPSLAAVSRYRARSGLRAVQVPDDLVAQVDQVLAVDHHRGDGPADPRVPHPVNALPCLPAGELTRRAWLAPLMAIHELDHTPCQAMLSNGLSGFRMSQPVKLPA